MKLLKLILSFALVLPFILRAEPTVLDNDAELLNAKPLSDEKIQTGGVVAQSVSIAGESEENKSVDAKLLNAKPLNDENVGNAGNITAGDFVLIDQIECIVCGPEKNTPIVNSDISWKRDFDVKFIDINKQIQQEIINQHVVAEKMPLEESAVEKYIDGVKKQLNLSEKEVGELFADLGRTLAEGTALWRDQYFHHFFMLYKFKSQLVPTDDEVVAYFNEYPEFINGWVEFQFVLVPYDESNKDAIKKDVDTFVATGTCDNKEICWGSTNHLAEDEVATDKSFILNMQKDQVEIRQVEGAFELYKLIAKEPVSIKPLSDCKAFIVERLNKNKLEQMLADYNKSINDVIDVLYLNDQPRN